jgi:hypothetical protein
MPKSLIEHIAKEFKSHNYSVLLLENSDGFMYREDVKIEFHEQGIVLVNGSAINRRINFELRDNSAILVLLSEDNNEYLEDIKQHSFALELHIDTYIQGYHVPSIVSESISVLNVLFHNKQIISFSKSQTIKEVDRLKSLIKGESNKLDIAEFKEQLAAQTTSNDIDWKKVSKLVAEGILDSIGTSQFDDVLSEINEVNLLFQDKLEKDFKASKSSSAVKRPKIVSKILEYLDFNFKEDKIALIVVDGLSFWQYEMLSKKLPGVIKEEVIYSWIPSITQLSRQAIFLGDSPNQDYKQGPVNEDKLWNKYWLNKGLNKFEIRYNHEKIDLENLNRIKRFALVYKDLDDYMHSSKDYKDLLKLTENWIERSQIISVVAKLLEDDFKIFITTDHGNIQAKGWRGLLGNEKLGTNKSGSRSERHLEYSEKWLSDDFMKNNPDLHGSVVNEDQAIYFTDDKSFSRKESLVTHGGAHLLEVLIPFIEITNE